MARKHPAKKVSRARNVKNVSKASTAQSLSLTKSDKGKLRKLLKAKTADSLTLVTTLLKSADATAEDYREVFTTECIADLVKPSPRASTCECFQVWEQLLAAVEGVASIKRQVIAAISSIIAEAGHLSLSDVTSLSDAAAEVFAKHHSQLDLTGLTVISDAVARALARHKGYLLNLNELATLSESAAGPLAAYKGALWLNGLTSISESVAKMLASHGRALELNGIAQLSDAAAQALAEHKGKQLSVNGLTTLSDEAAKALAQYKGELSLGGLEQLSDEAAKALAQHKGKLSLRGLEQLSDAAAELLAANTDIDLPHEFGTKRMLLSHIPAARRAYTKRYGGSTTPFIDLVDISPGTFVMGSPPTENGHDPDERQVTVRITKPFRMSRTVITQVQWRAVMGSQPWCQSRDLFASFLSEETRGDLFPAVWIDWDLATRFCTTLTELDRRAGRLTATQSYRLPTEAEWEYACRAGTTTAYSFGDHDREFSEYGWWRDNSHNKLHKVGLKKPNAWGLHDMHGNVWEWCSDWYDTALLGGDDPAGPATEPVNAPHVVMGDMPNRVIRGGDRLCKRQMCRAAYRGGVRFRSYRGDVLFGFRVVCSQ